MTFKTFPCLLLLTSIFVTSCKKELQPQDNSTDTTTVKTAAVDPSAVAPTAVTPMQNGQPVQSVSTPVTTTTTAAPAPTAPGMNPPHGQPNHRCDIAVGAPLNSPASKSAPAQTVSAPMPVAKTPSTIQQATPSGTPEGTPMPIATTTTAPGMNPPHGQAGHSCSVAVGAPLPK